MAALAARSRQPQVSAPGPGNAADSLMLLKQAVDLIQQALPGLGAGTEQHTAAIDAIRRLSRHMPQGGPVAGVQQTQLHDQLRSLARNAMLQQIMQNRGVGAPGGPPGGAPGGAAPMPSPAMPGA